MPLEWIEDTDPKVAPFITYSNTFSPRSDDLELAITRTFDFIYKDYSTQIENYRAIYKDLATQQPNRLDPIFLENLTATAEGTENLVAGIAQPILDELNEELPDATIKLPAGALNGTRPTQADKIPDARVVAVEPELIPDDAVITIIIDEGMNPFHACFRTPADKSRVLLSWQQAASYKGADSSLVFGDELTREDVEATLRRIANGDTTEERAFYDSGLINTDANSVGTSMLARNSHGMHTAGLATGRHMDDADGLRNPVILINLPPRSSIGTSGVFLPAFITPALLRAFEWLDALWVAKHSDRATDQNTARWKTVVNISYGQSAGPKDGTELLEQQMTRISDHRHALGAPRPVIVMPVGNNNLESSHITFELESGAATKVAFRVQPQDYTPTQLEIWTTAQASTTWPFKGLLGPKGTLQTFDSPPNDAANLTANISVGAQICGQAFARRHEIPTGNGPTYRFQFVFILNPTHVWDQNTLDPTPSGEWELVLENVTGNTVAFYGDIEVDQSLKSDPKQARNAYFLDAFQKDRKDYAGRFFDVGDIRQTSIDTKTHQVKQVGCHNALANSQSVTIISGHRASDGLPAPYSSAMRSYATNGYAPRLPDASFVCDDASASPGVLSAGIKSGSASLRNGTSFAAATATRHIVQNLLHGYPRFDHTTITHSDNAFAEHWKQMTSSDQTATPQKIGSLGRAPRQDTPFVHRLSSGWR